MAHPTIERIRRVRREIAAEHDYDPEKLGAYFRSPGREEQGETEASTGGGAISELRALLSRLEEREERAEAEGMQELAKVPVRRPRAAPRGRGASRAGAAGIRSGRQRGAVSRRAARWRQARSEAGHRSSWFRINRFHRLQPSARRTDERAGDEEKRDCRFGAGQPGPRPFGPSGHYRRRMVGAPPRPRGRALVGAHLPGRALARRGRAALARRLAARGDREVRDRRYRRYWQRGEGNGLSKQAATSQKVSAAKASPSTAGLGRGGEEARRYQQAAGGPKPSVFNRGGRLA